MCKDFCFSSIAVPWVAAPPPPPPPSPQSPACPSTPPSPARCLIITPIPLSNHYFRHNHFSATVTQKIALHQPPCPPSLPLSLAVQRAIAALGRGLAHHAATTPDHRLEKLYWCHRCHYRSDSKSNLLRHLRTHTGEKRHGCPVCPYRAGQRSDLRRHLRVHALRVSHDTLQCRLCDFTTATPVGFAMHIMDTHSTNSDQHDEDPIEDPLGTD
ncbi:hypothetical protein Pmani_027299 [Petrolisthes manimaculis]|uniref:C2H2-type domain-containing protein n=1 Tax=Petrolisthes manimaculis TaxID=1843537 RepID=A0AAE1TX03_9EUCA|nr:hypothetical protein Pmani_027299 [Petrolisthes manimaculis]